MVGILSIFRFLVEFNLYSWWYSDLTAKGKNALFGDLLVLYSLSKANSHMHTHSYKGIQLLL